MSERTRVITGAAVGAIVVYLVFTKRGRNMQDRVRLGLGDVSRALRELRRALGELDAAAHEVLSVMDGFRAGGARGERPRDGGRLAAAS